MDFSFHIQQGQQLLDKQDANSVKKALEHFKKANEMTEDEDIGKPKTLYHLALGNYYIGQIEQSYRIAHKAKRSIDTAIENSMFSMNNMRQMLGENDIDALIQHIDEKFPQVAFQIDTDDDDFDENDLDFSRLNQIYPTVDEQEIEPEFSIDDLDDEVLAATYFGLSRTNDELVYFDKLKGDVLSHVQGYFSSHIGDQSIANRRLANRITNGEPTDFVDEERYILINRLKLSDFLNEYKKQSNGKEPFNSFVDYFSEEILKEFSYDNDLTIDDLANSNHIQEKFHEIFSKKYQDRVLELREDYSDIYQETQQALALKWIKAKVYNKIKIDDAELEKMKVKERFELRRKCAENGDIKSLLTIAKYHFIHGSAATNETNFPELCYYYGRLHRFEELKEFLNEKEFYLFMLPDSCKELAQNLLNIGLKFPHLNEQEISYLEQKYCDSKTFELFDIIMFDSDKLARPIKKFDKNLLNVKNTDFSRDFLLKVFGHFSENEELDDGYSQLYVYSRITNKIIRKKYEDAGLGEYCIVQPIHSNEFYNLLNEKYGAECADYCIAELSFGDDLESFKTSDFYLLNAENIEEVANDYFQNSSKVEDLKAEIARLWLNKINSQNIKLT